MKERARQRGRGDRERVTAPCAEVPAPLLWGQHVWNNVSPETPEAYPSCCITNLLFLFHNWMDFRCHHCSGVTMGRFLLSQGDLREGASSPQAAKP